ncbi:hypothetical protein J421_4316 [Gemmatirosa kalamazoonensis]|uniref:Uncharacterized protein n=1 Tax=Gemmatirosa kalamazoonensis TaxID=861299 RepID=W0RQM8_9BACT|nr:hypothetical protein [Gemmatirosa kalamazoonensis]AHG91853.1 hypothetical protein J421_4316 [Gemmatirosa kalamazoonensis]
MPSIKYPFPQCLSGLCQPPAYSRWLARKASAHRKRDRARGNQTATIEAYKSAIHAAVASSGGVDAYTGRLLRWDLISTYDNEASRAGKRAYKASLGDLPSVDHVGDGLGAPHFRICAWRTNDAKNDLSYTEFVELCRAVIAHHDRVSTPVPTAGP